MEFMMDHAYVMKLPKTPEVQGLESFWAGGHVAVLGEWPA